LAVAMALFFTVISCVGLAARNLVCDNTVLGTIEPYAPQLHTAKVQLQSGAAYIERGWCLMNGSVSWLLDLAVSYLVRAQKQHNRHWQCQDIDDPRDTGTSQTDLQGWGEKSHKEFQKLRLLTSVPHGQRPSNHP
jgi:hypothetical protein